MKALITGVTGMVGSHLADLLLTLDEWEIVGMSRWRSDMSNIRHLFPVIDEGSRMRLVYGDLTDAARMQRIIDDERPDVIFHLAAQSYPQTSFPSPAETLGANVMGTCNLLEAVRWHAPEAVVHVCSSSEVFGRVPRHLVPIDEETRFHPASPYAISKAGTDLLGSYYAQAYGVKTLITRMFTHTGPRRGDVFAESSFAKQIAEIELGYREPIIKVGNLESTRTVADVRDAVRAYVLLVTRVTAWGEAYNIGGAETLTVGAILDALLSFSTASDVVVEVDPARLRPLDADLQIPNVSKFVEATGWAPEIPFEVTMRDLLDYWRDRLRREGPGLAR